MVEMDTKTTHVMDTISARTWRARLFSLRGTTNGTLPPMRSVMFLCYQAFRGVASSFIFLG